MPRRSQINANPGRRRLRAALAVVGTHLRDVAGVFEEHVIWRAADLLKGIAEMIRWPFERVAWMVERRLIWPLQKRTAGRGVQGRTAGAGALAAIGIGAVALGIVLVSSEGNGDEPVTRGAPVAVATPATPPTEDAPADEPGLQGAPPKFGVEDGVGVATSDVVTSSDEDASEPVGEASGASDAGEEDAATSSSQKQPVSAGPAAMKVARRFSEAFVFYEIGERPARAVTVFEETATPTLAAALTERPPRLPKGTEVPKARVLNLVPGPRDGNVYTVSASLLRVGVTSELRLKLTTLNGAWVVTDVRG